MKRAKREQSTATGAGRRRHLRRALALLAASCMLMVAVFLWPRDPLSRAVRVTSMMRLHFSEGSPGWVSNDSLLLWSVEGEEARPVVLDVRSGKVTPDRGLLERIAKAAGGRNGTWLWNPAPGGKWLLGECSQPLRASRGEAWVFSIDSPPMHRLPSTQHHALVWLNDGVTLIGPGRLGYPFYKAGQPAFVHHVMVNASDLPQRDNIFLADAAARTHAPDGRMFAIGPSPGLKGRPALTEVDLNKSPVPIEVMPLSLPSGASDYKAALSPDGSRAAWTIDYARVPLRTLWDRIRARVLPGGLNRPYAELCVSQPEGKEWRVLGAFDPQDVKQAIYDLRWTPDGKRLIFQRDTALWILPVD